MDSAGRKDGVMPRALTREQRKTGLRRLKNTPFVAAATREQLRITVRTEVAKHLWSIVPSVAFYMIED